MWGWIIGGIISFGCLLWVVPRICWQFLFECLVSIVEAVGDFFNFHDNIDDIDNIDFDD